MQVIPANTLLLRGPQTAAGTAFGEWEKINTIAAYE